MALLAALVIFTVVARYCFSLSWKQLAEFNTTLFAFTTFWGMGINVIKDEHVMIDILYDGVKPARKRWLAIINYLIVLAVVLVFTYQGFKYVGVAGKQISQGMEIPMMYMYGIMPVCGIICAICVVIKIITLYKADISYFAPKNPGARVTIETVGGQAFDKDALYTIATNDFTAAGGDTYYAFKYANATAGYKTGVALEDALVNYVQQVLGGVVGQQYAQPQGRITIK